MRPQRGARSRNDDDRILPLINVVFLLLIFFMVAGRLAVQPPFPVMPPPSANEGTAETADIVVHLAADGRLAVAGVPVDEAGFAAAVARAREERPDAAVRLEADGDTEALRAVDTMERLRAAGIERLRLTTARSGG